MPELGDVFNRMDEPHERLHQSAVAIIDAQTDVDWRLPLYFTQAEGDHFQFANRIYQFLDIWNNEGMDGTTRADFQAQLTGDHTACNLGQLIEDPMVRNLV